MNFNFLRNWIIAIIDWFYKPFRKYIPLETFRYAACGGGNMVLDTILYFISYNFILKKEPVDLGFTTVAPHIAAFIMAFCISFPTGFLLNKYITFIQSELKSKIQLFRYGVIVVGSILFNFVLLELFVEYFDFYPTPSKMLTTAIIVVFSYFSQKYYSFKTDNKGHIVIYEHFSNEPALELDPEQIADTVGNPDAI
ncbi:MAG TPA: GtrA family protein [Williamwhitmania sp.]|nr:GtrA family protein [Williamwhitmania sp.]